MYLIIDVGNTTTNISVFSEDKIMSSLTFLTPKDGDFNNDKENIINKFSKYEIKDIYVSSVVPSVNESLKELLNIIFNKDMILLNYNHIKSMKLDVDNPLEVGSDLIAASLRAKNKYGYPIIVADLGTANKVMAIDKNGNFVGVSIFPGMLISYFAMTKSAEKLPESILKNTTNVIGKNTVDCMNSGTINSVLYAIKGFFLDFEKELGYKCKKVVTGGYSKFIYDKLDDVLYDPSLTIEGIYDSYIEFRGIK